MADPSLYTYPDPLEGYENREPLSDDRNPDGKSLLNPTPTTKRSPAYTTFPPPLSNTTRGGFDIHIYYLPSSPFQTTFARNLHSRIRYEFPELRIYPIFDRPIGPHTTAMFEVNLFTPEQFGAFVPWLVINRGPLSALLHPNTGEGLEQERDHTQRATWLGQAWPLEAWVLRRVDEERRRKKLEEEEGNGVKGKEEV
ncbi:hypothetical protein CB0940_10596 [Cercospora beticola]|uniref:21.2 kDa protein n=1 Tax=Cercospora beticola TaxID=122368 RepID=A0A2G5HTQ4_CERBT|nr:hypothetical protein CB0940_10596 [Cercospora beticola]PIA95910.1 hypothetical protein CB0940_10596 [Cercospora beticola]WPB07319.1 hypothetical protein RHO25_011980 [Cercospora beticola]